MRRVPALVLLALSVAVFVAADSPSTLPRSTPEKQGISSSAVLSFIEAADEHIDTMNSFILVRHGSVVAEGWWTPYDARSPHMLYSLSKSFTSTAVGLAVGEGKLSVDDPVLKFFPEDAPAQPSENLKSMRVSDLLRMSAGHQTQSAPAGTEAWTKTFLAHPVPFKPGTRFLYNTPATYMLSAIVQKATGMTVLDFLRPRLFDPHETNREVPATTSAVAESPAVYRPRHPERTPSTSCSKLTSTALSVPMKNASSPAPDPCGPWSSARSRISSAVDTRREVSPGSGARSAGRSTCWPFDAAREIPAPVARPSAPCCSPKS